MFLSIGLIGTMVSSLGCAPTLSQPFQDMKSQSQPITIYRLQNYESQASTGGVAAPGMLPPQIQQWMSAGAQLLPPGLLPPGLLPGTALTPAPNASRFHNFPILGTVVVTDSRQRDDIMNLFGSESNFVQPRQACMFAEFGFQIGQGPAPGSPAGAPAGAPPADILVSLSCDQVQLINYNWPHGTRNGLGPDTSKKIIAIVQRAFGS